jgi:hypothetical protein
MAGSAKMLWSFDTVLDKVALQLSRDSLVVDLLGVLGPSPKVRGG